MNVVRFSTCLVLSSIQDTISGGRRRGTRFKGRTDGAPPMVAARASFVYDPLVS